MTKWTYVSLVTLSAFFLSCHILASNSQTAPPVKNATMQIGGFVQWDFDQFNGLYNNDSVGSELSLRRARIIFKGKTPEGVSYNLTSNYNTKNKEVEFLNAFIQYSAYEDFDITLGRFKEPFSMEALSSILWTPTIERSVIINKPNPIRAGLFIDGGIMLSKYYKRTTWALAMVNDRIEDANGKDLFGVTGRVTHAIDYRNVNLLHFGLAHAYRNVEKDTPFSIKEPLSVATAGKQTLLDTTIDGFSQSGLEFAYQHHSLSFQSELISSQLDGATSIDLISFYTLTSMALTGESRQYKNGLFGPIIPNNKRAIELVAKYERNETSPTTGKSGETSITTLGLNLYFNKCARFSLNYLKARTNGNVDPMNGPDSGDAISARMQLRF